VFLREGYVGYVTLALSYLWGYLFYSFNQGLEFLFFVGVQGLSCSHSGECSVNCGWEAP
jgi:hypothetical protein